MSASQLCKVQRRITSQCHCPWLVFMPILNVCSLVKGVFSSEVTSDVSLFRKKESVSSEKSDFFLNLAHLCQCLLPSIPVF